MAKSILKTDKHICFRCGRYGPTDLHHIFGGTANRRLSDEDGLLVYLCHRCHNQPPCGVHFNKDTMLWMRRVGQRAYEAELMKTMSPEEAREEFMRRYGKNYL